MTIHSPEKNDTTVNVCMTGKMHASQELACAGEVMPREAFEHLSEHSAVLVDVRTPQEWQLGQPDLSKTPSRMLSISWRTAQDYALNPQFAGTLAGLQKINKDTPLFFMCKSGGRSLEAALAMTAAGYRYCFNIRGGFEGKPDMPGWKTNQLPWK